MNTTSAKLGLVRVLWGDESALVSLTFGKVLAYCYDRIFVPMGARTVEITDEDFELLRVDGQDLYEVANYENLVELLLHPGFGRKV